MSGLVNVVCQTFDRGSRFRLIESAHRLVTLIFLQAASLIKLLVLFI